MHLFSRPYVALVPVLKSDFLTYLCGAMTQHFKDKIQVFVIGLLLGLLVAGSFFIFKLDSYFTELKLYKRLSQKSEQKVELKKEEKIDEMPTKAVKSNSYKPAKKINTTATVDTLKVAKVDMRDSITSPDTLKLASLMEVKEENTIVVKKDILVSTRQINIENLSPVIIGNKDSLLNKVSGVRKDNARALHSMNVEFWNSPINYKGYKMTKNKIVLFGITDHDEIKLYTLEDTIYLKLKQGVFKLLHTDEFRQFDRVSDETLLVQLK